LGNGVKHGTLFSIYLKGIIVTDDNADLAIGRIIEDIRNTILSSRIFLKKIDY